MISIRIVHVKRCIAGMLAAAALFVFLSAPTSARIDFADVSPGDPYLASITDLADRGIINGYGDGNFGPGDPVTRQQFAKMIVKTLGVPVTGNEVCPFRDVTKAPPGASDPFYPDKYVAVCYERGLTAPNPSTLFAPFDYLSRAQLITFAARAADLSDPPASYAPPFGDFSAEHYQWARKAEYFGLLSGLQGVGQDFDFLQNTSRSECAQVLHNLFLVMQPISPTTTVAPSTTVPVTQQAETTTVLADVTTEAATPRGPVRNGLARWAPYLFVGCGVLALSILAGVYLLLRRRQSREAAKRAARFRTDKDAREVLREWDEKDERPRFSDMLASDASHLDLWERPEPAESKETPGAPGVSGR